MPGCIRGSDEARVEACELLLGSRLVDTSRSRWSSRRDKDCLPENRLLDCADRELGIELARCGGRDAHGDVGA